MKTRKPLTITSRSSSITNAFVQAIIPYITPSKEEIATALSLLGMSQKNMECIYCGDKCSDWDHLFALVKNKRPSGYFSDIGNMVPACGRCNQSKGGQYWKDWMLGSATNSPTTRSIIDVDIRINKIEQYIEKSNLKPKTIEHFIEENELIKYWQKLEDIHTAMREAQNMAKKIQLQLQTQINAER